MLTTEENTTSTQTRPAAPSSAALDYLTLDEWQEFVESHHDSTLFHHRRWIETIQAQYGLDLYIPCLKSGGETQAAIPFLAKRTVLGGTKLYSLPFTDYLRILSRRADAADALVGLLTTNHHPCNFMNLRTDTPLAGVPSASYSVRHEVRLGSSFADLTKHFKTSVHRNLQKAQRAGLEFATRTDADAMGQFYRLHVRTRRRLGVPVQPKHFFQRIWEHIVQTGFGHIGLVNKAHQPVAGGVFLAFNGTMIYKYAASEPAALGDRPNDWLVYSALQRACDEGCRAFDFGISNRAQEGLRRFKCNWGAAEIDVHTVQLVGRPRSPLEQSATLKAMRFVVRNSPAIVCRSLGEVLYRFAI